MLNPFEWTVLTVDEAKILISYIEQSTRTKTNPRNYDKMQRVGILIMYQKLRGFIETVNNYEKLRDGE